MSTATATEARREPERTPHRMVTARLEMTSGEDVEPTAVPHDVGHLPGDRALGLSEFARMVEVHARRPQTQEGLTQEFADHLDDALTRSTP